jgi:hypothetical protein
MVWTNRGVADVAIGTIWDVSDPPHEQVVVGGAPSALGSSVYRLLEDWRRMALKASRRHSSACDVYERRDALYGSGAPF